MSYWSKLGYTEIPFCRGGEKSNIWIRVTALSRLDKTSHDSPLLAGSIAALKQVGKDAVKKVLGR